MALLRSKLEAVPVYCLGPVVKNSRPPISPLPR